MLRPILRRRPRGLPFSRGPWSALSLLALALTLLSGCHTGPHVDARNLQPLVDTEGHPRSLAFASPQQRQALADANFAPGEPWFATRNDHYPSVDAGYHDTTYERSYTRTVDRQRVIRGRVFDAYRETTHRERVRESWR
ncbi:hypothetical protein ACERK3_06655 [Phycisphaerales bacterium AB-hyl4]|uniref:Uncharacterized protein n=1 Tax=Natronomicrosphaera hydrolytica TaxID=3242702 RepID=A0ABV4U313_9BACT